MLKKITDLTFLGRQDWQTAYSSLAVFLFFSLSLIAPSGYSWGALLLLAAGMTSLITLKISKLKVGDWLILAVMFGYAAVQLLGVYIHDLSIREFDKPFRFVLAGIALLYLLKYPPKQSYFWTGISIGACGAGAWAMWQVFIHGADRAGGFTMIIQFGNLSLLLGLMSAIGLLWAFNQEKNLHLKLLFVLGFFLGLVGSILSGTRGGWVAVPFTVIGVAYVYRHKINCNQLLGLFLMLVIASMIIYLIPAFGVSNRIDDALRDIENYLSGHTTTSLGTRFELWRGAIIIFMQNPFFGVGEYDFNNKLNLLKETGIINPEIISHAHNDFLDILAKSGFMGLISIFSLYFIPLYLFITNKYSQSKEQLNINAAGVVLCICYTTFGLSQSFLQHNSGVMFYSFGLAIIWSIARRIKSQKD